MKSIKLILIGLSLISMVHAVDTGIQANLLLLCKEIGAIRPKSTILCEAEKKNWGTAIIKNSRITLENGQISGDIINFPIAFQVTLEQSKEKFNSINYVGMAQYTDEYNSIHKSKPESYEINVGFLKIKSQDTFIEIQGCDIRSPAKLNTQIEV